MAVKKETKPKVKTAKKTTAASKSSTKTKEVAAKDESSVNEEEIADNDNIVNDQCITGKECNSEEAVASKDIADVVEEPTGNTYADDDFEPEVFVVEHKKEIVEAPRQKKFEIPKPKYHPFGIIYD